VEGGGRGMGDIHIEYDIVALMRCKRRAWQYEEALVEILEDIPRETGLKTFVVIMPDSPTPEVQEVVNEFLNHPRAVTVLPDPVDGHRWAKSGMDGMNKALQYLDSNDIKTRWLHFRDDDEIFGSGWESTLHKLMNNDHFIAYTATSLYIWGKDKDGRDMVNLNQFHHSPVFCRYVKGHRFNTNGKSVQVTDEVQRVITRNIFRAKTLPFYLIDRGAICEHERIQMVKAMNAAGKDDMYTRSFIDPPKLVPLMNILTSGIHPIELAERQAADKGLLKHG
jgi:hypothetical protein